MDHGISISVKSQSIGVKVSGGSNLPAPVAENDFIVANTGLNWIKKTLDEIRTILGLRSAAYTDSTDYAVSDHNHAILDLDHVWTGTEAEYEALGTWDNETLYFNTE